MFWILLILFLALLVLLKMLTTLLYQIQWIPEELVILVLLGQTPACSMHRASLVHSTTPLRLNIRTRATPHEDLAMEARPTSNSLPLPRISTSSSTRRDPCRTCS